jgi:hypothetical protein
MILLNTSDSKRMAVLAELCQFAKEHDMTGVEFVELVRMYADINPALPEWRTVVTRIWLGLAAK